MIKNAYNDVVDWTLVDNINEKKKKSKELQIIRSRSGSTAGFPQNGLLQRKPETLYQTLV